MGFNWNPVHIITNPTSVYRALAKGPLKGVNPKPFEGKGPQKPFGNAKLPEPFRGINPQPFRGINPQPFKGWDQKINPPPGGRKGGAVPAPLPQLGPAVAMPGATSSPGSTGFNADYLLGRDLPSPTDPTYGEYKQPAQVNFAALLSQYAPALQQAAGGLESAIARAAGMTGAANAKTRANILGAYGATGADQANAQAASMGGVANIANQLGVGSALAGPNTQAWQGQASRLAGLANTAQAGAMSNLDFLQNARQGAFNTLMPMGRAMAAAGTSGIANTLAQAEAQDRINRQKSQSDYELAKIEGTMKTRQMAQDARDREVKNRINLYQLQQAAQNMPKKLDLSGVANPDVRSMVSDYMTVPNPATGKLPTADEAYASLWQEYNTLRTELAKKKKPKPEDVKKLQTMVDALPILGSGSQGYASF